MEKKYDFGGWATKHNMLCSDGRTISKNAFLDNDGQRVPLVWNHGHKDAKDILGHADLINCDEGVYCNCAFNDTDEAKRARLLVQHGDITSLSIYANQLKEQRGTVLHGNIREVSLVMAPANPGAIIDSVLVHGDGADYDETEMFFNAYAIGDEIKHSDEDLSHADGEDKGNESSKEDDETVADVLATLNEKQKKAVAIVVTEIMEGSSKDNDKKDKESEGGSEMKQNAFAQDEQNKENELMHSGLEAIIADGKRQGSLKESFLAHAAEYGIEQIDYLIPDAKNYTTQPEFIKRPTDWVAYVMNHVHKTPFSRIKTIFADITEDEARAKGYIKGKLKKEEVFSLLKRTTTPTTIYKKQKMDRDDIIDITDFDVVAWIKSEMRIMLDEEIARAILIGDGRLASSDDKINESNIRPVWKDESLYTIRAEVTVAAGATAEDRAKAVIKRAIKARKDYRGSGSPAFFTTEDMLTDMLLIEDGIGHALYADEAALARKLRVSDIITVPVMEGAHREVEGVDFELLGLIVNLADYNLGADKGGAINMFDDFDIDYNQQKYLMETRCSGALVKPFSAIAIEAKASTEAVG